VGTDSSPRRFRKRSSAIVYKAGESRQAETQSQFEKNEKVKITEGRLPRLMESLMT